jgi:hypothetical protein
MAEVVVQFEASVPGPEGRVYRPRACGRVMDDGRRWEGWIEFEPNDESSVLRTSRETVQPNREDLRYWATGLTTTYFEGALQRALLPPPTVLVGSVAAKPAYDEPAPEVLHFSVDSAPHRTSAAVLDPYHVYAQGEEILRQELAAMEPQHLRNIINAYRLVSVAELDLLAMSRTALADLIVAAVRKRDVE